MENYLNISLNEERAKRLKGREFIYYGLKMHFTEKISGREMEIGIRFKYRNLFKKILGRNPVARRPRGLLNMVD